MEPQDTLNPRNEFAAKERKDRKNLTTGEYSRLEGAAESSPMPGRLIKLCGMANAEAKISLALRREPAKGKIFSHIRNDWFVETPEELVRQLYVCTLVNDYGFSLGQMDEEIETSHGRNAVEADIVIWRTVKDIRRTVGRIRAMERELQSANAHRDEPRSWQVSARHSGFVSHARSIRHEREGE